MIRLKREDIVLNKHFKDKITAIEEAGKLLKNQGYISEEYIEKMIERDELTSTFLGNMVAIPHGTEDAKKFITESGIVLIQVPNGVNFDGNEVKLIIGIAGVENEHLALLAEIALVCSEIENVEKIITATSEEEIIDLFQGGLVA